METTNAHWTNRNEGRPYPVDDAASCRDDAGLELPPDLIADLNLRWPADLGRYAFLGAVAATAGLVTVTIQASDDPDAATGLVPLAVVSAARPVQTGRVYAVQAQAPGVGGWVTFGRGVEGRTYGGRFSTPAQSRLAPRAARAYRRPPVHSLSALGADAALTGVVTLKAEPPLAWAREEREVDGVLRDCAVLRLVDDNGAEGFATPADAALISGFKQESVFSTFAGPCAGRPEAGTCGCPEPVQFVNAVAPDCDGLLTVEFRGCAQVTLVDGCGIALACNVGLIDACVPPAIPNEDGLLPSEADPANVPPVSPPPPPPPPSANSESYSAYAGLPAAACFPDPGDVPLEVEAGLWEWAEDDGAQSGCPAEDYPVSQSGSSLSLGHAGSYQTASAATRSAAVWPLGDVSTLYRRATTAAKMTDGGAGTLRNAALVVNHRAGAVAGQYLYHYAEVDYDTQTFRLGRFNGTSFQEVASALVPGLLLDTWYRITAEVRPGPLNGQVSLVVAVADDAGGPLNATVSATVANYGDPDGDFGLGTRRSHGRFAYLRVEGLPP